MVPRKSAAVEEAEEREAKRSEVKMVRAPGADEKALRAVDTCDVVRSPAGSPEGRMLSLFGPRSPLSRGDDVDTEVSLSGPAVRQRQCPRYGGKVCRNRIRLVEADKSTRRRAGARRGGQCQRERI